MPDPRTRKRALWIAPETTYATDPGSGYLAVPHMSLSAITDNKAPIPTARFTGRIGQTPMLPGADGGSFGVELESVGLTVLANNDGESPPAEDVYDEVWNGIGVPAVQDAVGVVSHSGTSLTVGSDVFNAGDLLCLQSGTQTRWVPIETDNGAGSYTLAWDPGITALIVRGTRIHSDDQGNDTTQTLTSVIEHDAQQYTLPGGRITAANWTIEPNVQAKLALTVGVDAVDSTSKTGLAAQSGRTPTTPLRAALVYLNGVALDVSSIGVDLGIVAQPRAAVNENGRSDHLQVETQPIVSLTPIYTEALYQLKRDQTEQSLLVQIGTGLRSECFYAPVAQVQESPSQDDGGVDRLGIQLAVLDPGSTGVRWRKGRC